MTRLFRHALPAAFAALLVIAGSGLPAFAEGTASTGEGASAAAPGYSEAQAAVDAGQYREAMRILATVVKAEPRNADAWNLLGYCSRQLKNFSEAGRYYDTALRIDSRHVAALGNQGELFVETGDYDKARQNLKMLRSICGTCQGVAEIEAALNAKGQS